jgi:hypothetical protein
VILEFDVHLKHPREMFVFDYQAYDPFDENSLGEAGLSYMTERVIGFWFAAPQVRARVFLPSALVHADTQDKMQRAMQTWCQDLLIANARERTEFLINNTIFLGIAIAVLVFNFWAQAQISDTTLIRDESLRGALVFGLDILLWVALWTPVSAFLMDWFPLFRKYQAYKSLQHMNLTVHVESPTCA